MCASSSSRRTVAEIDFGANPSTGFRIGDRSIHHFWHLFSAKFHGVLLAPQRRPDSSKVVWAWREAVDPVPVTAQELADVRRRLNDGSRLLSGSGQGKILVDDRAGGSQLDAQVRSKVIEMVAQLIALGDHALAGFVGRTETGLMVHSWGAVAPGQPHHPGASESIVSGVVFVGPDRTGGLTVVLENQSGGFVARAQSGDAGAFSFPNVVPGKYRIRVTGRADFPSGGLALAMERESVTGLELRNNAPTGQGTATSGANPQPDGQSNQRRASRIIAWFVLSAVLLGGGVYYWRVARPLATASANDREHSGWQAASGKGEGSADQSASTEGRPPAGGGGFSRLSPTSPRPNSPAVFPRSGSPASRPDATSPDGSEPHGDPSAVTPQAPESPLPPASSAVAGKSPPPVSAGNKSATAGEKKRPASRPNAADTARDRAVEARKPDNGDAEPAASAVPTAENGADVPSPRPKTKSAHRAAKNASVPLASPASGPTNGAVAGAETPQSTLAPDGPPAGAAANSSAPPAAAPARSNSRANQAAANSAPTPAGSPDSPSPDAAAASSEDVTAQPAAASAAQSAAGADKTNHVASATPTGAKNTPPDSPTDSPARPAAGPELPEKTSPTKSPTATKPSSVAAPNKPPTAPAPSPEESPADDTQPTPGAATTKADKPKASAPSHSPKASPAAKPPSLVKPENAPAVTPESSSVSTDPADLSQTKSSGKNPAVATKAPQTGATGSRIPPKPAMLAAPADTPAPLPRDELIPVAQISNSGWIPRQLQDLILPTEPVPAAAEEAVAALREKLRREQIARMPAAFRGLASASGFAVEWPADKSGSSLPPHWSSVAGPATVGATVQGNRAEVAWPGTAPAQPIDYLLSYPDGRVVARVRTDRDGAPGLETAPFVLGWYWVGIDQPPGDDPAISLPRPGPRFSWRLLSGPTFPASWRQSDHWSGGRGDRLDLPLNSQPEDSRPYSLALFDPLTGWAVVAEIRRR